MSTRTVSYASSDNELFREQMRSSRHGDGADPRTFAYLLEKAAENKVWESLGFATFKAFLEAAEPDGLGMSKAELDHAAALAGVSALANRLYAENIKAVGPHGSNRHTSRESGTHSKARDASAITARLKRDDPELAARVVQGEVTPNAAARAKGWRKPRIVVSSPESVARSLRKHMSPDDLAALVKLLTEGEA